MGLFDFFRSKKKKEKAAAEREAEALASLNDVDPSEIDPPETRYTQEYRDYLTAQEAAAQSSRSADAPCAAADEAESCRDAAEICRDDPASEP